MKKYLVISLLWVVSNNYSQQCLPRFYSTSLNNVQSVNLFKYNLDTILLLGSQLENQTSRIFFQYIDKSGNQLSLKYIDSLASIKKVFQTLNGELLIVENEYTLCRFNKSGDLIWKKHNFQIIEDVQENLDGSIILVGQSNTGRFTYIEKIDSEGNSLSSAEYNILPSTKIEVVNGFNDPWTGQEFVVKSKSISKCGNGDYLISGIHGSSVFSHLDNVIVMRLDSNLNIRWRSTIDLMSALSPIEIYENENGNTIVYTRDEKIYYDGGPPFYERFQLSAAGELLNKSSFFRDKDVFHTSIITQNEDILISSKRIFKLDKQGAILAITSLKDSLTQYSIPVNNAIIEEASNEYFVASVKNKELYLTHYPYFGNDCLVRFKGIVYDDQNGNCSKDSLESGIKQYFAFFSSPNGLIYMDNSGKFDYIDGFGTNKYYLPVYEKYYTPSCGFTQEFVANFTYPDFEVDTSFAVNKIDSCFDIALNFHSNIQRPCELFLSQFSILNIIDSINNNFNLDIEIPEEVSILNCNYPYSISDNVVSMELNDISGVNFLNVNFLDSLTCDAVLGDTLCFYATFNGVNHCDSSLIIYKDTICNIVKNSFDPNLVKGLVDNNHECYDNSKDSININYTIHFQNTGNDVARDVYIVDDLDSKWFNLNSLIIDSSSHSYVYLVQNDQLKFTFKGINLPDSTSNEPLSKGFIAFHIKAAKPSDFPIVYNRAAIYFDHNEAIITNWSLIDECETTSATDSPQLISDCQSMTLTNLQGKLFRINNSYQNIQDYFVYDVYGNLINSGANNLVDFKNTVSGIYFIKVVTNSCYKTFRIFVP